MMAMMVMMVMMLSDAWDVRSWCQYLFRYVNALTDLLGLTLLHCGRCGLVLSPSCSSDQDELAVKKKA